ncbi:squalene/phytoene synthase family protein [Paracoccus methylovorus]|uniref:Squalene/phytoene synthase family protein n=1 Tax=Paracoccus methylovorus TaxID=2812658 RepID=A0ABX7JIN6_9RHOB|nr:MULTISPECIES: squalene/phytoene synthase family protein [Paracoccus]QRZ14025.1 squalene/phytoene synthase family protein [Paracoccus methylovorus]
MSLEDCANALRAHDPDRFGICLMVASEARPKLLTLYALNLELARAPLASTEPLIAEMRLQWWIERLEDIGAGKPQSHELLTPLAEAWGPRAAAFATLAEPRRRDAAREPHNGPDAVAAYVRDTAVPLASFAAEALDGPTAATPAIAAQAEGVGLAHWLVALPALQGLGLGLWDPSPQALGQIATKARTKLAEAKAQRRAVPRRLAPLLFPGAGIQAALQAAPQGIEALAGAAPSEFRRRLALGAFALGHRWWI